MVELSRVKCRLSHAWYCKGIVMCREGFVKRVMVMFRYSEVTTCNVEVKQGLVWLGNV